MNPACAISVPAATARIFGKRRRHHDASYKNVLRIPNCVSVAGAPSPIPTPPQTAQRQQPKSSATPFFGFRDFVELREQRRKAALLGIEKSPFVLNGLLLLRAHFGNGLDAPRSHPLDVLSKRRDELDPFEFAIVDRRLDRRSLEHGPRGSTAEGERYPQLLVF